jgi:competence protein ComEA
MLDRHFFFLFDKIKITKSERTTIMSISVLLLIVSLGAATIEPNQQFDDSFYEKTDSLFSVYQTIRATEHAEIMARYETNGTGNTPELGALTSNPQNDTQEPTITTKAVASKSTAKNPDPQSIVLNLATQQELSRLPGIGPKTADAILEYRREHGPFQDLSHITRVKGIGSKKWEQIRPYLRLNE